MREIYVPHKPTQAEEDYVASMITDVGFRGNFPSEVWPVCVGGVNLNFTAIRQFLDILGNHRSYHKRNSEEHLQGCYEDSQGGCGNTVGLMSEIYREYWTGIYADMVYRSKGDGGRDFLYGLKKYGDRTTYYYTFEKAWLKQKVQDERFCDVYILYHVGLKENRVKIHGWCVGELLKNGRLHDFSTPGHKRDVCRVVEGPALTRGFPPELPSYFMTGADVT